MSRASHVLFAEHWAVITPLDRKLSSRKEQGNSACELTAVSGKRKAAGQADKNKCVWVGGRGETVNYLYWVYNR